MPDEVREHLTRDQRPFLHPESLQILQIHSSMTVLLLSVHLTHFLHGSGQRTGMAIAKAWFCAQWHIFCVVFKVCFWIIVRLEDPNMAHYKISNRVSHLLIFYLLVFDRIHDAMCLNKMFRTSSRNIGPQHQKYSSIFHCTHGVLFIPVFPICRSLRVMSWRHRGFTWKPQSSLTKRKRQWNWLVEFAYLSHSPCTRV